MELFSRTRWRLVYAAHLSYKFVYFPWCTDSIVLAFLNTTAYHLVWNLHLPRSTISCAWTLRLVTVHSLSSEQANLLCVSGLCSGNPQKYHASFSKLLRHFFSQLICNINSKIQSQIVTVRGKLDDLWTSSSASWSHSPSESTTTIGHFLYNV